MQAKRGAAATNARYHDFHAPPWLLQCLPSTATWVASCLSEDKAAASLESCCNTNGSLKLNSLL